MRVFAYCDQSFEIATRQSAGSRATVVTCPPTYGAELIDRYKTAIEAADLIIFNFDSVPGHMVWYLQNGSQVIDSTQLSQLNLINAIVFMLNCYRGGGMLAALKSTRPKLIIGGAGKNLGGKTKAVGTDILAMWFRRLLSWGVNPQIALALAKGRLRIGAQTASVQDAQNFGVIA